MNEPADIRFDTSRGCARELANINRDIASFDHAWSTAAGELRKLIKQQERLTSAALRGLQGEKLTVQDKAATAALAVEKEAPGLAERIEELEGDVERYKTRFKALDRRATNAQSILGLHRDEGKLQGRAA